MTINPAVASNAGDRYHFIYVARRALDVLHGGELQRVEIEGVAASDAGLAEDSADFLAVDVAEYYGGIDSKSAKRVDVVQLKYSSAHPNSPWTLARLTYEPNRGGRSSGSVIGKLAAAHRALSKTVSVALRIVTNQPLDDTVRTALERARDVVNGLSDAGRALSRLAKRDPVIEAICQAVGGTWKECASVVRDFQLDGFSSSSLLESESALAAKLDEITTEVDFQALIGDVQKAATPGGVTTFDRTTVLRRLKLNDFDIFPAPARLEPSTSLFSTGDSRLAATAVLSTKGRFLLLHGAGGIGKTTALQLLERDYTDSAVVVIYDCYGANEGRLLDSQRFPLSAFLTQVVNELDARLATSILATTRLKPDRLSRVFARAVASAADRAAAEGKRLVIGIDAVDNAASVARVAAFRSAESFIPLLPNLRWPENCVVVLTSRTENIATLGIPDMPSVQLNGFSFDETRNHVQRRIKADESLIATIHERTAGNARVQVGILEELDRIPEAGRVQHVIEKARTTAFEYYRANLPERIATENDRVLLAMIAIAAPPVRVETIARISGSTPAKISAFVQSLAFGLRVRENAIEPRNQDFIDFAAEQLDDALDDARQRLANYCLRHFDSDDYALWNVSRHLFEAKRYSDLVAFWLDSDRLRGRLAIAEPHTEAVLHDVQYALLAANLLHHRTDVLRLIAIAADVAQGRDVFAEQLREFPDVVVGANYTDAVLAANARSITRANARCQLDVATSLARVGDMSRAMSVRDDALVTMANTDGERNQFAFDEVTQCARFDVAARGLAEALARLSQWSPVVEDAYAEAVTFSIELSGDAKLAFAISNKLDANRRAHAFIGLLRRADIVVRQIPAATLSKCARFAASHIALASDRESRRSTMILEAVEALIRARLFDGARSLLAHCREERYLPQSEAFIRDPLRRAACAEVLGEGTLDPASLLGGDPASHRIAELRIRYGSILCRARAWAGATADIEREVDDALAPWRKERHWTEAPRWGLAWAGVEVVEAILCLPQRYPSHIWDVAALLKREFVAPIRRGYARLAEVLAFDARYHAEAEALIREAIGELNSRSSPARDVVAELLRLYAPASLIDPALATEAFRASRIAAAGIDATLDARLTALVASAEAARLSEKLTTADMVDLAGVVEHSAEKALEIHPRHTTDTLATLSTTAPALGFAIAAAWDDVARLPIGAGFAAVAHGILSRDDNGVSVEVPLALAEFADDAAPAFGVFERILRSFPNLRDAFDRAIEFALRQPGRERFGLLTQIIADAEETGISAGRLAYVRELLAKADAKGLVEPRGSDRATRATAISSRIQETLKTSPGEAFDLLCGAVADGMMDGHDAEALSSELMDVLSSARAMELATSLANARRGEWNEIHAVEPYSLIISRWPHLRPTVRNELLPMLTAPSLQDVLQIFDRKQFDQLRLCWGDDADLFDTLTAVMAKEPNAFGADSLYRWIGRLAFLVQPDEALAAMRAQITRMLEQMPPVRMIDWEAAESPTDAAIRALADCLGHPRVAERWRAVYALTQMAIAGEHDIVARLIRHLSDESHGRWMTKREWLLFTLHHIAYRRPDLLVPVLPSIVSQALDTDFPHAVIRECAKQIALLTAEAVPAALDGTTRRALAAVNVPKAFVKRHEEWHIPVTAESNDDDATSYEFDPVDVVPYWYDPLGRCFNMSGVDVTSFARRWIVEKWGIEKEQWFIELKADPHKYDYGERDIRHGTQPSVETLRTYVERHAMYLSAGTLVDTRPVVSAAIFSEDDAWSSWLRDQHDADPALPGRFLIVPPLSADNYGKFAGEVDAWRTTPLDVTSELFADGSGEWVVIAADKEGYFYDRDFSVDVRAVLTSRTTVRDSGLFYASADELHHKELISRIELRNTGKLRGDSPAASWIDQELDFDRADPRFPRSSRRFFAPSAAIRKMLGLTRSDVTKLEWTHEDVVIARTEIWCDTENTPRSDFVYGSRLLMRASSVQEILLKTRKRLIAHVSLHRGTGYRDQSSRERNVFEQHVDIGDLIRRTEKSAVRQG